MSFQTRKKRKRGGVLISSDEEHNKLIFLDYIDYGEITYIAKGSFGMVLKIFVPDMTKIFTPFLKLDQTPLDHICIKLCLISDREWSSQLGSVTYDDFQNELNIQADIVYKTMEYMHPICPGIMYANVWNRVDNAADLKEVQGYLKKGMMNTGIDDPAKMNKLFDIVLKDRGVTLPFDEAPKLGIIVMDLVDSETLGNLLTFYKQDIDFCNLLLNMGRYALLRLALETGYNHGDFHSGNILIKSSKTYFSVYDCEPIIIDFGRAKKLPSHLMRRIRQAVDDGNYVEALSILCDVTASNEFVPDNQYDYLYGWVCGDYKYGDNTTGYQSNGLLTVDPMINSELDEMFWQREQGIDQNRAAVNNSGTDLPLLPISRKHFNGNITLYNGFFKEGKYS